MEVRNTVSRYAEVSPVRDFLQRFKAAIASFLRGLAVSKKRLTASWRRFDSDEGGIVPVRVRHLSARTFLPPTWASIQLLYQACHEDRCANPNRLGGGLRGQGPSVQDVGANAGAVAGYVLAHGVKGSITCTEPDPENLELFGCSTKVTITNLTERNSFIRPSLKIGNGGGYQSLRHGGHHWRQRGGIPERIGRVVLNESPCLPSASSHLPLTWT